MIAIIGRGNVATHLYEALKDKTPVCMVNPHTLEDMPANPDIILVSVKDDAISDVVSKIPETNAVIAHTAGSIPIDTLARFKNHGVFYPLQTFTKHTSLDYSEIPVFIEASNPFSAEKLMELASLFSNKVIEADSETRKSLHIAAVFACNFSNAMAAVAEDILKEKGLNFDVMLPLLSQTINKLKHASPRRAQTGPASRGDLKVMDSHLEMLKDNPCLAEIYKNISDLISQQQNL